MQNRLRPKTVKLISKVLTPWVDNGEVLPSEMQIIKSNLNSLAQWECQELLSANLQWPDEGKLKYCLNVDGPESLR